jgi:TRAP-type C4-dicarboxylate transport system permease small subunit
MKEQLFKWLNLFLMFNLFFVLACFGWFTIALIGRSTNLPLGLDLWYRLWTPVIQPAIGILMAGALISGAFSWVSKKLQRDLS